MKTHLPSNTEEICLRMLKNRDSKAFDFIYDHYGSALFGIVTRQVHDRALMEDAFVKIFVKIWKQIDGYKPAECRLFTWMHEIAQHELEHLPSR